MTQLAKLTRSMAQAVVKEPDLVWVEQENTGDSITIQLRVAEEDLGRAIGRKGKVINAMQTVLRAAGGKWYDQRVDLKVEARIGPRRWE